jgi:hypothetical protein
MMQPSQHREGEELATCVIWWHWSSYRLWNLLPDALMRPGSVEVEHIRVKHTMELLLMQDKQMIEALAPDTAQKPFTHAIRSRSVIWYCENLDVTCLREPCVAYPELAIMITDEVLRSLAIGGSLSQLLCGPGVGRTSCDADMDHFARVQFDDEERKQKANGRTDH